VNLHHHHGKKGKLILHGKDIFISDEANIDITGNVTIKDYTTISKGVKIFTHKHDYTDKRLRNKSSEINVFDLVIGEDVFIGEDAMILGPTRIGKGAIIGARAVVTKNVPDYEMWAGNPARKVKERVFTKH